MVKIKDKKGFWEWKCPLCGEINKGSDHDPDPGHDIFYICFTCQSSINCNDILYPYDDADENKEQDEDQDIIFDRSIVVSLTACQWKWTCPSCNHLNKESEFRSQGMCKKCYKIFLTF